MDLPLFISAPFTVHYKLLTANTRKFINIYIQGTFKSFQNYETAVNELFIGLTDSSKSFLFKSPEITLSEAVYKNPSLSKLELKNINFPDQILVSNLSEFQKNQIYFMFFSGTDDMSETTCQLLMGALWHPSYRGSTWFKG